MTNSYDVAHGLSQVHPGPEEPVEIAQQDETLARTGNTARDQEMYVAGIRTGEENTKHNAAIRAGAGWLPIESAPKDGTPVLLFARLAGVNFATNSPYAPTIHVGAYRTDLCIWTGSAYRDQREIEIEPTHWMPLPAFPDCAAPGVSTVEEGGATPGATWRENGEGDPHGARYNCERAELTLGTLTDDELANGAFLAYDRQPSVDELLSGKGFTPIVWMTAVKDRIRWLSRKLAEAEGRPAPAAGDALYAARYRELRRKVCIAGSQFHILNLAPTYVAPDAAVELDSVLDAAIAAQQGKGGEA